MSSELPEPVRILSDVHWGHSLSLVRRPEQLLPLIEGAGTVVFNGDTIEERGGFGGDENAEVLAEQCRRSGAEPVFLNGNHDPGVSPLGALEWGGGRVLVTHGDVLFPEIAVWKKRRPELKVRCERLYRNGAEAHPEPLEAVVESVRSACGGVIREHACEAGIGAAGFLLRQGWPPSRPWHVFRCWAETGPRGARLAAGRGSGTRFVILGHTHYPGVWRSGDCTVINTGSFFPLMGGRVVELADGTATVRRVERRGEAFGPGRPVGRWEVFPEGPAMRR